jgi:hypothetical protein
MSDIEHALYAGSQNALTLLLEKWTDDNDLNRAMVETLLANAMLRAAGLA